MGSKYIIKKPSFNQDLSYIHAVILGDGTLTENGKRLQISDRCLEMHSEVLKPVIKKTFGIEPKIVSKGNGFVTEIKSVELFRFLRDELNIPVGKKSYIVKIPDWVLNSDPKIKKSHIIGWMDAEGAIKYRKFKTRTLPRLAFGCMSENVTNGLIKLLNEMESHYQTKLPVWKWKSKDGVYHFEFAGPDAVKNYMKFIGLKQKSKKSRISKLIKDYDLSCRRQS